jgi:hypothetical protein
MVESKRGEWRTEAARAQRLVLAANVLERHYSSISPKLNE